MKSSKIGLYLESKSFNVERFASAKGVLQALEQNPADCIVCDVRMAEVTGLELQRSLNAIDLSVPLILITGHGDIDMAVRAIKDGAYDFLEKPFQEHRLVDSIRSALEHSRARKSDAERIAALRALQALLTDREREVMHLAVEGLTSREIGARLQISFRTVEIHRAKAMEKMGAQSLAELVRMAISLE